MAANSSKEMAVTVQSMIISGFLLSVLWVLTIWLLPRLIDPDWTHARNVEIGIKLFLLWLVTTSTLRSINKVQPKIEGWKLIIAGMGIALAASLLFFLTGYIWQLFEETTSLNWPGVSSTPFFLAVGFIISVISTINLKVKNTFYGNVLEVLFIALIAFLFFYFVK